MKDAGSVAGRVGGEHRVAEFGESVAKHCHERFERRAPRGYALGRVILQGRRQGVNAVEIRHAALVAPGVVAGMESFEAIVGVAAFGREPTGGAADVLL